MPKKICAIGGFRPVKPNDNELKMIVDFINKHKEKSVFMVHCSAGISRSGAVATFLYDKFLSEIDKEQFRRENKYIRPNLYILNRLKSLLPAGAELLPNTPQTKYKILN